MSVDDWYMVLVLLLGWWGMGCVWFNLVVGCVIVKDGVIVGCGWIVDGGCFYVEF